MILPSLFFIVLTAFIKTGVLSNMAKSNMDQSLTPYVNEHGSKLSHRAIRDCHKEEFGSPPHELFPAHTSTNLTIPFATVRRFVKTLGTPFTSRIIRGHVVTISNPAQTLSVIEPDQLHGCSLNVRQTVLETGKKKNCFISMNAGYFNTKNGKCLGNVVSDGRLAHDSGGIQNAHFGLTSDGKIFTGYVSHEEVMGGKFQQLVGGVMWILRNGTGMVNTSKKLECEETEETGPMETFINILSARSAVGHDKNGNVILVQIDGQSQVDGINLYEMETLLQKFGVVNAINLDGGGSSTLVIEGVTANYPYDACDDPDFSCDRKVSTVLCVHSPYCDPANCNGHGTCMNGECVCNENWTAPTCDQLLCSQSNCSNRGVCLESGCVCHPGFYGKDCNESCPNGWYGSMCNSRCDCLNSVGCDAIYGICNCTAGFTGDKCLYSCPLGYFGPNCLFKCQCNNSCFCDPATGACEVSYNTTLYRAASCLAESLITTRHLVKENIEERNWYIAMLALGVITALSITSFIVIMCCSCSCYCRNDQVLCMKKERRQKQKYKIPSGFLSESESDSETLPMHNLHS